jgi:hypothetical protein
MKILNIHILTSKRLEAIKQGIHKEYRDLTNAQMSTILETNARQAALIVLLKRKLGIKN